MSKLIECVPNFSEGADLELVEDILSAVKTAKVLDVHSDADHNRSVATIIGAPEEVKKAAFDLTERAMQLLDVRKHAGVHPFIGVVDVIPFIPLADCSMSEVQSLAHALGEELWEKLQLPVYFYGEAAKIAGRKDLSYVRKGGYKELKLDFDRSHRRPDVGHGLHVTAGAAAVGARDYLIAFNVNLNTPDIAIAKSIAYNIREKNGGLPGVRALGLELASRNITQVSINLVDHEKTSIKEAFDAVVKGARENQVEIVESEIVGLIPAAAEFSQMKEYLRLNRLDRDLILDNYL